MAGFAAYNPALDGPRLRLEADIKAGWDVLHSSAAMIAPGASIVVSLATIEAGKSSNTQNLPSIMLITLAHMPLHTYNVCVQVLHLPRSSMR
jgi:hypothetical protein